MRTPSCTQPDHAKTARPGRSRRLAVAPACILAAALALASGMTPGRGAAHAQTSVEPLLTDAPAAPAAPADRAAAQTARPLLTRTSAAATVNVANRQSVVNFYNSERQDVAVTFSGSQASCVAGDTPQALKDAVLRRINYFRAMAGVPADISFAPEFNAAAQQAALMMSAQGALSHSPPSSFRCYTSAGAQSAGSANLALGAAGPEVIDLYVQDYGGNNAPVGHRRWLLYPQTRQMGTGDVPGAGSYRAANALRVFDNNMWDPRPDTRDGFVAWPPPGFVPYPVVYSRWSFSYPDANFAGASVTMRSGGVTWPVRIEPLVNGYGENTLVWLPNNMTDYASWPRPSADQPIEVTVSNVIVNGVPQSFTYMVTVIDPAVSNFAPTAISLSQAQIAENSTTDTLVGTLSSTDPDAGDAHTYALVAGVGDTNNAAFTIAGNQLRVAGALDHEKADQASIRVRSTDSVGNTFERAFSIAVTDVNEAPAMAQSVAWVRGESFSYSAAAADPEAEAVSLSLVAAPAWLDVTIDGATATLSGDATNATGDNTVRFQLTDTSGNSADATIQVIVVRTTVSLPYVRR